MKHVPGEILTLEQNRRLGKNSRRMTPNELRRAVEEIRQIEAEYAVKLEEMKKADPFWFFDPCDGKPTEAGMQMLRRHLKEEDIPQRFDGQMDVFRSKANKVGISGATQSGKSLCMVVRRLILATGAVPVKLKGIFPEEIIQAHRPRHYRCVGIDLINGLEKNVIPKYKEWTPKDYLIGKSWDKSFSSKSNTLTLVDPKTGEVISTIEFMSNKADEASHQGPPMDGLDFDEEPDYGIYKENLARLVTAKRLDIQFGWTPTNGLSWSYKVLYKGEGDEGKTETKTDWFKIVSVANKSANLVGIEELVKDVHNYEEKKMRLLGDYVSLSGLIYGNLFDERIHVIEPFEITFEQFIVYRGIDPHTSKDTFCVEIAVDREGTEFVCGLYHKGVDTEIVKRDLADRAEARNYRLGWTRCDKSANSTNKALGNRNIFKELGQGVNAIPGLMESEKFTGSIHAGVDEIKKKLKLNPIAGKPGLFIFNIPELKPLIYAMKTLERDTYQNEEKRGMKDKINEGPHDAHAAFRYPHQSRMNWLPVVEAIPVDEPVSEAVGW